ncbi:MAG: ribosome biogenesis GTPase YlqF [Clostridia bacterium]|nr:ribosome biogenesis GTPase YlqF [Clostridia bacterium]
MPSDTIQWFPGHMAKTRRLMAECLPLVDIVLEILDARIPKSSSNPDIRKLTDGKPLLKILNKSTLADPRAIKAWKSHYESRGISCLSVDCISGEGLAGVPAAVRAILADKVERYQEKGMAGRRLRAMIVGIPNVGKSSLINRLSGGKKAKVENRPGVTMTKQWVPAFEGLDLLDMPGVLWPKFESHATGLALAVTGAIKDQILDLEEISCRLLETLAEHYPERLAERYKVTEEELSLPSYDLMEAIGAHRGFRLSGGVIDTERTAKTLLDEFRKGTLGCISLEWPPKGDDNA